MKHSSILLFALATLNLSACGSSNPGADVASSDPRMSQLVAMDTPEYYANLRTAARLSEGCASYEFNRRASSQSNDLRNKAGKSTLAALGQRKAIDQASTNMQAAFEARYGVKFGTSNLCAIAANELAAQTPLSIVLSPAS